MKSVGTIIRANRIKKNMTQAALAKKIKIHPGYVSHLECDYHVHLGDKTASRIIKILALHSDTSEAFMKLREKHNEKSSRWYAKWRKSQRLLKQSKGKKARSASRSK